MRHTYFAAALLSVAIALAGATALHATERRPLPAFMLTSLGGQPVASTELPQDGHWLLIYVEPSCRSCLAVLNALRRDEHPGLSSRVVVVVAGSSTEQALALVAAAVDLSEAAWLIDRDRSAGQALGLKHSPVVIGIRGSMIEWGLTGVLNNSVDVQSVLVSWLQRQ